MSCHSLGRERRLTRGRASYILGSWYKEEELGKRTAVFTSAAQFGSLFSGVLAGAAISNLNGKLGRPGWVRRACEAELLPICLPCRIQSWLFVIDFAITAPVATYGAEPLPEQRVYMS